MDLTVCYLPRIDASANEERIRAAFADLKPNPIAKVNWEIYPYAPTVSFKIGYTDNSILLQYNVNEKHLKACYSEYNDAVYKDSCVEFFFSFDGIHYYNFEFNCIGNALVAHGTSDKTSRVYLSKNQIDTIQVNSHIQRKGSDFSWNLTVNIPINIFIHDHIKTLKGLKCTGNFYKCGDDLPIPHFLSWNAIHHPEPNFHLPAFFGELIFEE